MQQKSAVTKIELFLIAAVLVMLAFAAVNVANASGNQPRADADADAAAHAGAAAGALAGAHAESGDNSATGGAASNDGNTLDAGDNITNARSTFFSFNRSMPAAGKCFGTVDGGGGDSGGAGFLGFNYLNKNCWYAALAGEEQSVEVKARLKCGSKHFRNAISYDKPRKERQTACIGYMVRTYIEQLKFDREQLEAALAAQSLLIMDHTTKETERTTAQVTRAVESCTDCFGEK